MLLYGWSLAVQVARGAGLGLSDEEFDGVWWKLSGVVGGSDGSDVGSDGSDVGSDVGRDVGSDVGSDIGSDIGSDVGSDGSDIGGGSDFGVAVLIRFLRLCFVSILYLSGMAWWPICSTG